MQQSWLSRWFFDKNCTRRAKLSCARRRQAICGPRRSVILRSWLQCRPALPARPAFATPKDLPHLSALNNPPQCSLRRDNDGQWALLTGSWGAAELGRSEEHTSELQSPCNLVCRLLLEKKKKNGTYYVLLTDVCPGMSSVLSSLKTDEW